MVAKGGGYFSIDNLSKIKTFILTILDSNDISDSLDLQTHLIVGILVPTTFSGGEISFQISYDGINFEPVFDTANNLVKISTPSLPRFYGIVPQDFTYLGNFRIKSDTAQTGDSEITIVTRRTS